jgi:hypothetical protein
MTMQRYSGPGPAREDIGEAADTIDWDKRISSGDDNSHGTPFGKGADIP